MHNITVHIIDEKAFKQAMKEKGYRSIGALAKAIGVHRNTVHHYLSGNGVFPESLEKMFEVLGLDASDVIVDRVEEGVHELAPIASVIDMLSREFPETTFVLFGSRARGRAHVYADWDIGVYARRGISHEEYRAIALRADELADDMPYMMEVVNLCRADPAFLRSAAHGWKFLAGSLNDWIDLERKVAA